jgi:hypothetical protein
MTHPFRKHYDRLLLALAMLVLGGSLDWVRRQQTGLRSIRAEATVPVLVGTGFQVTGGEAPHHAEPFWSEPGRQSRGEGWRYEVFAPPAVFYDPVARDFALSVKEGPLGSPAETEFHLALLAVNREAFRLQLAGYFGAPGDYRVAFVSPRSPDTLLARVGDRLEMLGLVFKGFEVSRVLAGHNEGAPVQEAAAIAVLQDEWNGGEVMLDSRALRYTGSLLALLRLPGTNDKPSEWREGDSFVASGIPYRIERIQLEPAEVVVSRIRPGLPGPELQVLQPADHGTGRLTGLSVQARPVPQHAAIHGQ